MGNNKELSSHLLLNGRFDTKKMRQCAVFLGEPGDQVCSDCCDELDRMYALADAFEAELERVVANTTAAMNALANQSVELVDRCAAAEARVAELERASLDHNVADLNLEHILTHNGLDIRLNGGACALFAEAFANDFVQSGAVNYVEARFESSKLLPGECFTVTLQKVSGKSPHELRREAEARAEANAKDAGRYRWLRNCANESSDDTPMAGIHVTSSLPILMDGEELDQAIDAAMAREAGSEQHPRHPSRHRADHVAA